MSVEKHGSFCYGLRMKRKDSAPEFEVALRAAMEAAQAGGSIVKRHGQDRGAMEVRVKAKNDFVTRVDNEVERTIVKILHRHFPDHQILAEEKGIYHHPSPFQWVIDPLDGTANYIQGIPQFAISIGLMENERPYFGLIYNPTSEERFYACRGNGSFRNEEPIRVSQTAELEQAFGATGFPFKQHEMLGDYLRAFEGIMKKSTDMRRCGSAALDLAYTACGRYDFFWEAFLQPWDFMAGAVIIEEAGGKITNFLGRTLGLHSDSVIAGNPKIFNEIRSIIQPVFVHS